MAAAAPTTSASDTNLLMESRTIPLASPNSGNATWHGNGDGEFGRGRMGEDACMDGLAGDDKLKDYSDGVSMVLLTGNAGYFSSCVNLLKTIIGAGIISLPFAFSLVGILPGTLLLLLAVFMSGSGLFLLAKSSHQVCNRDGSFASLAAVTYPRLSPLFDGAVALKCLGVSIGYLKIIGDLLPETIKGFTSKEGWFLNRMVWVTAIVLFISPVTFMRKMDSLKYTSFLGLLSVLYLICLSAAMWVGTISKTGSLFGYGSLFAKFSVSSFRAFPIMVFAFCCHQNLFPIQNEAKKNSPRAMLFIINVCLIISMVVYMLFATGSYASFNTGTVPINANIINNYPTNGIQFILARFLYIFLLTFSFPMMTYPTRESIFNIARYVAPNFYQSYQSPIYYGVIVFILLFTWLIACVNPPLDFVLGLIGSTAAPIICFFLPAVFWLKIDPFPSRTNPLRIGSIVLIGFAVLSTGLSLTALVLSVTMK